MRYVDYIESHKTFYELPIGKSWAQAFMNLPLEVSLINYLTILTMVFFTRFNSNFFLISSKWL